MPTPLESGRAIVEEALPVMTDLDICNKMLVEAGRPDLAMTEQVALFQISSPDEVDTKLNNFTPGFYFQRRTDVPVTEERLRRLRVQPDYIDELFESNPVAVVLSHAGKPAFQRMLALFPDFTIQLVLAFNQPEARMRPEQFAPDLFTAYQLMCKLVDKRDPYVIRNRKVDRFYFYR